MFKKKRGFYTGREIYFSGPYARYDQGVISVGEYHKYADQYALDGVLGKTSSKWLRLL